MLYYSFVLVRDIFPNLQPDLLKQSVATAPCYAVYYYPPQIQLMSL